MDEAHPCSTCGRWHHYNEPGKSAYLARLELDPAFDRQETIRLVMVLVAFLSLMLGGIFFFLFLVGGIVSIYPSGTAATFCAAIAAVVGGGFLIRDYHRWNAGA